MTSVKFVLEQGTPRPPLHLSRSEKTRICKLWHFLTKFAAVENFWSWKDFKTRSVTTTNEGSHCASKIHQPYPSSASSPLKRQLPFFYLPNDQLFQTMSSRSEDHEWRNVDVIPCKGICMTRGWYVTCFRRPFSPRKFCKSFAEDKRIGRHFNCVQLTCNDLMMAMSDFPAKRHAIKFNLHWLNIFKFADAVLPVSHGFRGIEFALL